MSDIALKNYLQPFTPFFNMSGVTEICVNQPGILWVEQYGDFISHVAPELTSIHLWQLVRLIAEYNQREISTDTPTLSSTLPNGSRIQIVIPPACAREQFIISIRRQSHVAPLLSDYFDCSESMQKDSYNGHSLLEIYEKSDYEKFLKLAVIQKMNIIISGGTSTGKTTFLNTLLKYIPKNERLITIETDREVEVPHLNSVHLLAADEGKSVSKVNMLDLLKVSLRLRPDRILVSELRSVEAFPYLRAINSGHPGSITTMHANSPAGCFEQLGLMVMQAGSSLTRQEIFDYTKSIVPIVVQIKRSASGKRYVSEIYYDKASKSSLSESNSFKFTNPNPISPPILEIG